VVAFRTARQRHSAGSAWHDRVEAGDARLCLQCRGRQSPLPVLIVNRFLHVEQTDSDHAVPSDFIVGLDSSDGTRP
jgi:hypothetical protein